MKICLIGAGRIGAVHAIAIASDENAKLHSVVDFHQEAAEKLAKKYNAITLNLDEAFNIDEIEAFIIASSTSTHADLIERCAKVGKPVFCEKPIDLSLDRALANALSRLKSIGFSQKTGFPTLAHLSIRSACVEVLLAMIKASISSILNASSRFRVIALYFFASFSAASW